MRLPIKIASRGSRLAIAQVKEVMGLLGGQTPYDLVTLETAGDRDKTVSLTKHVADDFFTDSLDKSLLDRSVDITIHSAKDLPRRLASGFEIFALTSSIDETDAWVSSLAWNELPQGAKVGTSSALRKKQAVALQPAISIVDIRGTIDERIDLIKDGKVDGVIVATCALKRLGLTNRIRDIFPWEGTPLQGQLAVVGRKDDHTLKDLFKDIDVRRSYGKVLLVGAGPGDPDLISLKAIQALRDADCVFYDYLIDVSILKYAPKAEHIYAGKRKGDHTLSQDELSRMLRTKAFEGKRVVRLKSGDPFIFGRGADEIQYLKSYHIPVEVIPGISSATGIPSTLGVPLTARGISSSVAFVSGHDEDEDKHGPRPIRIPTADTIVFLMGITKLNAIVHALREASWPKETLVLVVSKGTRADEEIVAGELSDIEARVLGAGLKPPALIIVGKTAAFYEPGKRREFLHCGTNPEVYSHLGRIHPWPMIELKAVGLDSLQQQKLKDDFIACDMVVLTSPTAVKYFMAQMQALVDLGALRSKIYAVIGKNTRGVLEGCGVTPQIVSPLETAEGLFDTLLRVTPLKHKKILFPRSSMPNPFLKASLEVQGAEVREWTVYVNTKPVRRDLPPVGLNGIIFTSPSTVKNFLEDYKTIPAGWEILAKGPVTKAVLVDAGYVCSIVH